MSEFISLNFSSTYARLCWTRYENGECGVHDAVWRNAELIRVCHPRLTLENSEKLNAHPAGTIARI